MKSITRDTHSQHCMMFLKPLSSIFLELMIPSSLVDFFVKVCFDFLKKVVRGEDRGKSMK